MLKLMTIAALEFVLMEIKYPDHQTGLYDGLTKTYVIKRGDYYKSYSSADTCKKYQAKYKELVPHVKVTCTPVKDLD